MNKYIKSIKKATSTDKQIIIEKPIVFDEIIYNYENNSDNIFTDFSNKCIVNNIDIVKHNKININNEKVKLNLDIPILLNNEDFLCFTGIDFSHINKDIHIGIYVTVKNNKIQIIPLYKNCKNTIDENITSNMKIGTNLSTLNIDLLKNNKSSYKFICEYQFIDNIVNLKYSVEGLQFAQICKFNVQQEICELTNNKKLFKLFLKTSNCSVFNKKRIQIKGKILKEVK